MSDNITLFCLVEGVSNLEAFEVEIEKNKSVSFLKEKIKEKLHPEFENVATQKIVLWKVNVPSDDDTMEVNIVLSDVQYKSKLSNPTKIIIDTFTEKFTRGFIHIIIERPSKIYDVRQEILQLRSALFNAETGNTKKSSSVYRYVQKNGIINLWKIENDISLKRVDKRTYAQFPTPPDIIQRLRLQDELLILGDNGNRKEDQVYADLIIGFQRFYQQLKSNPPDLSKGLGWKVKNDLTDGSKLLEGKGQLVKYARIYLKADVPLSKLFLGCLTNGNLWLLVRASFVDDVVKDEMMFEESDLYEWSANTASLIAGLINQYYMQCMLKASGEKREFPNNDDSIKKMHMLQESRTDAKFSPEKLLASFIKEGFRIRLNSGNFINVQIISHLGTGRDSIVFLVQICDYGITEAVLKIEVRQDSGFSQVYQEISVLRALDDLSCVPKILFEGHTMGGSWAIITDFVGQPLETLISDNGSIDDHTLFQILPDLLLCLEKIHGRGYAHGDVAIQNVIRRNERFYLIDYGFATMLQLQSDPLQTLIQDYIELCQIIGIAKFGEKMSLFELTNRLDGKLKQFVASVKDANGWEIDDEKKWLEKFNVASDKKEESHVLKGLIEEFTTDPSEVFEDLPLDGNKDDFLYLYNRITKSEVHSEIANQEVALLGRCFHNVSSTTLRNLIMNTWLRSKLIKSSEIGFPAIYQNPLSERKRKEREKFTCFFVIIGRVDKTSANLFHDSRFKIECR
ncbi:hypothetical protein Glove_117g498 [Diversispora epigaea]|uniref:Protein kinase domain-containing protein n=1 Tax=Diversispora epigaea TaxID=1348612 RepID=A0A397J3C9_9GLOM|nr:hypothetical protein Glove_117g498 [Diversispora epigaea]